LCIISVITMLSMSCSDTILHDYDILSIGITTVLQDTKCTGSEYTDVS
jgi:hypothetical protein